MFIQKKISKLRQINKESNHMEQQKLRTICLPLMELKSIPACKTLLEKYIGCFFYIINKHHWDPVDTQAKADARIWFQMFTSKMLNIQNLLNGIEYDNGSDHLKRIIDPTMLLTLVRNLFEAVCAFEIVNIIPDTDDKKKILYNLHCISGLKYRQRFFSPQMSAEQRAQWNDEKHDIEELIKEIKNTNLYKELPRKSRDKIDNAIKDKIYQIAIDENKHVKTYGWGDIPPLFGVKLSFFKHIYPYFCLNAHPSHISMMQFRDMFKRGEEEYINISISGMRMAFILLSIYLSDYIRLFPQIQKTYDNFDIEDQILLNFFNKIARGDEYSISDTWKQLG